ncbi:MAG: hypothetical protein JRI25_28780 [Deltaproteobacteria bacterium]|nr:hypothetical protein [Deltaproteobacteria bacterium]
MPTGPGCTNRLWLDVHHTHELSRGGDHREETLISLCSAHHGLGGDHREETLISLCSAHHGLVHGERVAFEFLDGRRSETTLSADPPRGSIEAQRTP